MSARRVRPTVRQVAERAGVSTATVSNALNGTGRLSEATRRRVVDAAHALSYVPYTSATAQARGGTGMLGLTLATHGDLAVPYTQIPYYAELVLAAIRTAHYRGYLLTVLPASMSAWAWLTTPLDGIVHCEPRVHDPIRAILERRGIPLVFAGRPLESRRTDAWIDTDDGAVLTELLDHFRAGGATRVAAVLPRHDDAYPTVLRRAYDDWCARVGQEPVVADFDPDLTNTGESAAVRELLRRSPRPDAVLGVYTDSGRLALEAALELGLDVPGDVAVACFSDDPAYVHLDPPVTTVSLRPTEVGAASVELLIGLVNGRRGLERQRLLPAELQVRASSTRTATPAVRAPRRRPPR
ncbi:DNA-binding LacI/PurR family transcriptional regulator [Nocardioides sp. BE266]|uniref:LacI family DNA-binding transcriptional regulator n=1 Tax=Nocardioides sp. BE266 TaxID=2817725 RepID=UPI0028563EE9|nr:LacI family DNA-binding transcriptional regulator [Nocardioides sp. BE266]MDR7251508.1 DNA-binding LacI/PurR family transcriptional regulator [Nocardioides sp. BE266]